MALRNLNLIFLRTIFWSNSKIPVNLTSTSRCESTLTKTNFSQNIKTITMSNPKTRNSLSENMMKELLSHITTDENNPELRAIVIAGEGPVFSSGHNLKELVEENGREYQLHIFNLCSELMMKIFNCPVPIIAKVDGLAAAAGCQLVAQCDIAVASDRSSFSTPGANFGLFCSTPGIPLSRAVPKTTAAYMLFTGKAITSQQAVNSGLIWKAVPFDDLDKEVGEICSAIMSKSRAVIELGKNFFYRQIREDIHSAYKMGGEKMVENLGLRDGKEGIRSFVEKRPAVWVHSFDK